MKKLYSVLLTSSLVCGVSTIAKAQPPNLPEPQVQITQKHFPRTPEYTIQIFVGDSGNLGTFYSDLVEGYDSSNSTNLQISRLIRQDIGKFVLTAKDITIVPDPQNQDLATANFTLEYSDAELGLRFAQKDSVQLKRHPIPDNRLGGKDEYWSIIPGNPQTYFKSYYNIPVNNTQPAKMSGFTERLATLIAYPKQMLPKIHLQQSELQLKQLGLSLLMFTQDYDDKVDVDQQNYVKKLTPYLQNDSIFTAPDTDYGIISYEINPAILGLSLDAIKAPSETVAFYLGHDQKLDFRYDGLSPVCFVDGHVKAVTPDEAKTLRWQP